jgi:molybdopterin converting factor small subunit
MSYLRGHNNLERDERVKVEFIGPVKDIFGTKQELVEIEPGETLEKLLQKIFRQRQVNMSVESFLVIYNDHGVSSDESKRIVLKKEDKILILPMLAGG